MISLAICLIKLIFPWSSDSFASGFIDSIIKIDLWRLLAISGANLFPLPFREPYQSISISVIISFISLALFRFILAQSNL